MNTMTTLATSVAALSLQTVFVGYKYTYQGEEVKVVKIRKKTNEVKVVSVQNKVEFIVRPHELEEVVMTNQEKATQACYVALKSAEKALAKAEKAYRNEKAKPGAVLAKTYKDATVAKMKALAEVHAAQAAFVSAKFAGSGYDRFVVEDVTAPLNVEALVDFYNDAMAEFQEVDKEVGKQLSYIYGLIAVVNIVKIAKLLCQVDVESEYTTAYRVAMANLRLSMTEDTDSNFKNIWHSVFGGNNKKGRVASTEMMFGYNLANIATAYKKYEVAGYANSDLVSIDLRGLQIQPFAGSAQKRISLRDAYRKIAYANKIVFVRVNSNDQAQIARTMGTLQRVVGMHASGIALEGLRDNVYFNSVVRIGFKGRAWDSAKVVNDPLCVLTDGEDAYTADQIAIAEVLRKEGFGIGSSAENYGKHGYIQMVNTYNREEDNAFINSDGSTYEDNAKVNVRLTKQVWGAGEVTFPGVRTIVVAGVNAEDLPSDVLVADQEAINEELIRSLVAGQAIPSMRLYSFTGTGRFVTGKEAEASGQKTVTGAPGKTMVYALEDVYNNAGGNNAEFMLAGLNSTKSTKFKFADMSGWKMVKINANGKIGYVWTKETVETYTMTYSATANAFKAVDEKVVGVEAALNSLARATESLQSETATKMIYAKNGKTLAENIKTLLDEGKIARKGYRVATNSQFNTGLEMQYGVETASRILEALVKGNKAISFRKDAANALALASDTVDEADVTIVDAMTIVKTIASSCSTLGLPLEDVTGKVLHVSVVTRIMELFANSDRSWARIGFGADKSVLIPVTQEMLDSFQETSRPFYVALEGMAAELFEAFAYHVQKSSETLDEETGMVTYDVEFTESAIDVTLDKIRKARDNMAGKPLNKVPGYGTTMLLITSAHLKGNELYSCIAQEIGGIAAKAYRQHVAFLYFKSPLLWNGSISKGELVDTIAKGAVEEWLKQFRGDDEYEALMEGTSSYISPEKAVKNGNDADGDQNSLIAVPSHTLVGSKLQNGSHFVDATDPTVAAGAYHYAKKWEKECKSILLDTSEVATLTTGEGFEVAFEESVIRAAREKANVAIFTSHQTSTLNNRGAYTGAFENALVRAANHPEFVQFGSWINALLQDEDARNVASEAVWAFNADVQGSCVNFDAMDQVKSSDSRTVKKLAALLSSGELKFVNFAYAKSTAPEGMSGLTIAQNVNKGIEKRVVEVYSTMFKPTAHNIAIDQLNYVLPAYTEASAPVLKKLITFLMVVCGSNVGYVVASKYDVTQQVAATAPKQNGRAVAADLEKVAEVQAEKGRELVEIECVQRTIATFATAFVGKRLV